MIASGVTGDALAALEAKYPTRRKRVEINTDVCPACGTTTLLNGDFCCGACSEIKVRSERRFWQHAADLDAGFDGRPKQLKPRKGDECGVKGAVASPNEPTPHHAGAGSAQPKVIQIEDPHRWLWLVTVGLEGRVVVAPTKMRAIQIVHETRGDSISVGHSALCLGQTLEPETPVELPARPKSDEPIERRFRISGPSLEIEVAALGRAQV